MNTTVVPRNPVYVPNSKLLVTPAPLEMFVEHFFKGVEPRPLKLKGALLERTEKYFLSLVLKGNNADDVRNKMALSMLEAFNRVPFVKVDYNKDRVYVTAIKKGSVLVNISKYSYVVKHVKGLIITYSVVTTTEVLSGAIPHCIGRWDLEVDDGYPEDAVEGFIENAIEAIGTQKGRNAYYILKDMLFSLTPYKK